MLHKVLVMILGFALTACGNEVVVKGDFTYVPIHRGEGKLPHVLRAHIQKAKQQNKKPFLHVKADWCPYCRRLDKTMGHAKMQDAFNGTYIIELDLDDWKGQLGAIGIGEVYVPVYYGLNDNGRINGLTAGPHQWKRYSPGRIANVLKPFFNTAYQSGSAQTLLNTYGH